jgi:L-alanine-DL-glutamate epimerase-like enolase superfamily enzyme
LDFLPLLNPQCANVIEVDVQYLGITGTLRVADAAFGYELPVTLKSATGNLPVHLASVLPNFMGMEVVDTRPVLGQVTGAARFANGRAWAGEQLGSGIAVVSLDVA